MKFFADELDDKNGIVDGPALIRVMGPGHSFKPELISNVVPGALIITSFFQTISSESGERFKRLEYNTAIRVAQSTHEITRGRTYIFGTVLSRMKASAVWKWRYKQANRNYNVLVTTSSALVASAHPTLVLGCGQTVCMVLT